MRTTILFFVTFAMTFGLHAKVVTRPVHYEQAGVSLEGVLAYDDAAKSARPGVLVVPEWWGLNDFAKDRARALAELGYVAFAIDMYGAGLVTTDPKQAGELAGQFYGKPLMAERARAGLDQLLNTWLVDPRRVAAIGFCFGGSVCQALAYSGAPLAGIVSFHGGPVPVPAGAAANIKAKFLICHGALDPFVKPDALDEFKKSLDQAQVDYQFVSYAGAVHAFTNPDADKIRESTGLNGIGYNEPAARRSWQHMKLFFGEIFATR